MNKPSPLCQEALATADQIAREKVAEVMAAGPERALFLLERGQNQRNAEFLSYARNGLVYLVETYTFVDSKNHPGHTLRVLAKVAGAATGGDKTDDLLDVGELGVAPTAMDLTAAPRYEAVDSWAAGESFRTEGVVPAVSEERIQALAEAVSATFAANPDRLACYININYLPLAKLEELLAKHPVEVAMERQHGTYKGWSLVFWKRRVEEKPTVDVVLYVPPKNDLPELFADIEEIPRSFYEHEYALIPRHEEAAFLRALALEFRHPDGGYHIQMLSRAATAAACRRHFACFTGYGLVTHKTLECLSHGPDAPPELLAVAHPVPTKRAVAYELEIPDPA